MRCCIDRRRASIHRWLAGLAILVSGLMPGVVAAPNDIQAGKDQLEELLRIIPTGNAAGLTPDQWAQVARRMGDPAVRGRALEALRSVEPFPAKLWVNLLNHDDLAVRLGALEVLEDFTGSDLDFDPWEQDRVLRTSAWQAWVRWAESGAGQLPGKVAASESLPEEAMQAYLRDLMSGDAGRTERALAKLKPHARQAIGSIESFLSSQSALIEGMRGRLKEAQYRLLLEMAGVRDSRRVGRLLAIGTRDERVEGLEMLAKAPKIVLPIVTEALRDGDGLVRERAMDVLLSVGGVGALPLAEEHLKTETETAVIHSAIRALGRLESASSLRLLVPYLKVDDEDQITSTLLSLSLIGESARSARSEIAPCLKHASWRVRAGALQCIAKTRVSGLDEDIVNLLDDPDSFVRTAAVQALAASAGASERGYGSFSGSSGSKDQVAKALVTAFNKHDDLKGPICKAFASMNVPLPAELMEKLPNSSPEVQATALVAFSERLNDHERPLFIQAVSSADLDLACIALRGLARVTVRAPEVEKLLVDALTGASAEKRDAVLEGLRWTHQRRLAGPEWDAAIQVLEGQSPASGPTSAKADTTASLAGQILQAFGAATKAAANPAATSERALATQVLEAFGAGKRAAVPPPAAKAPPSGGPATTLEQALIKVASSAPLTGADSAAKTARLAVSHLIRSGSQAVPGLLEPALAKLDVQDRAELPEALSVAPHSSYLPIWQKLLRDPSREVRQRAFAAAIEENERVALIRFALGELLRPGENLKPADVFSADLVSTAQRDGAKWAVGEIARQMAAPNQPPDMQVLGLVLLREVNDSTDEAAVTALLGSPSYWVRRAAVMTLAKLNVEALKGRLPELVKDESSWVREAAAAGLSGALKVWHHHFDDTTEVLDESYEDSFEYRQGRSGLFGKILSTFAKKADAHAAPEQALRTLTQDREARVRLAAWMALLAQRAEVNVEALTDLLDRAPHQEAWSEKLASYIENNYDSLGPALKPLLERIEWKSVDSDKVRNIELHFGLASAGPPITSFTALAQTGAAQGPQPDKASQYVTPESSSAVAKAGAAEAPVTAIFFHNPGCKECERVRNDLARLRQSHPGLTVTEYNIRDTEAVLLNEALSSRFSVPVQDRLTTPSVFFQEGVLLKDDLSYRALQSVLSKTAAVGDSGVWFDTRQSELTDAKTVVEKRYQEGVTLAAVMGAGLLDGINPCAFATLIFFLSYLQVSRRSPADILAIGSAFILSVFVTYFLLGLGLVEVVTRIEALRIAGRVLTWVLAVACLYIARLSFRDAKLADQGRLQEMSLQLPAFLKDHIRGVIRSGARSRRFIFAAAGAGVVISVLELACTGQVYIPTIVYALKTGSSSAPLFLLLYNIAFIIPLLVIFLLAWRGMRSEALIQFQQRHTGKVKRAMGWLFLVLFALLVFGGRL